MPRTRVSSRPRYYARPISSGRPAIGLPEGPCGKPVPDALAHAVRGWAGGLVRGIVRVGGGMGWGGVGGEGGYGPKQDGDGDRRRDDDRGDEAGDQDLRARARVGAYSSTHTSVCLCVGGVQ